MDIKLELIDNTIKATATEGGDSAHYSEDLTAMQAFTGGYGTGVVAAANLAIYGAVELLKEAAKAELDTLIEDNQDLIAMYTQSIRPASCGGGPEARINLREAE